MSESSGLKERIHQVVADAHRAGLFLFTYGDMNNDIAYYQAQKAAGVDAVIMDDVGRLTKVCAAAFCLAVTPGQRVTPTCLLAITFAQHAPDVRRSNGNL